MAKLTFTVSVKNVSKPFLIAGAFAKMQFILVSLLRLGKSEICRGPSAMSPD
jgi:hypothetical protein